MLYRDVILSLGPKNAEQKIKCIVKYVERKNLISYTTYINSMLPYMN